MIEIVLDSNILSDFLAQFFGGAKRGKTHFVSQDTISKDLARKINHIVDSWSEGEDDETQRYPGLIVTSVLAFVEIARKWDAIVRKRFSVEEMAAFVEQPPEWFVIDPIDESLVEAFSTLPRDVSMDSGDIKTIEWTDAIHITTALSRGEACKLATTDGRIRQIKTLEGRLL